MLFKGWSGDCTGIGDCVIDGIEAKAYNVTARFIENHQYLPMAFNLGEVVTDTTNLVR